MSKFIFESRGLEPRWRSSQNNGCHRLIVENKNEMGKWFTGCYHEWKGLKIGTEVKEKAWN